MEQGLAQAPNNLNSIFGPGKYRNGSPGFPLSMLTLRPIFKPGVIGKKTIRKI